MHVKVLDYVISLVFMVSSGLKNYFLGVYHINSKICLKIFLGKIEQMSYSRVE